MKLKLMTGLLATVVCVSTNAATTTETSMTPDDTSGLANKHQGELFLQKNKTKTGVVTLADGLQYKIIKAGKGPKPKADDTVSVEYEGRLINGEKFDSSADHGGSASFPVNQVIPGWTEALQLMPVGSTWELFIPSDLAYGEHGAPPAIAGDSTLIFKVKLLEVKKSS